MSYVIVLKRRSYTNPHTHLQIQDPYFICIELLELQILLYLIINQQFQISLLIVGPNQVYHPCVLMERKILKANLATRGLR